MEKQDEITRNGCLALMMLLSLFLAGRGCFSDVPSRSEQAQKKLEKEARDELSKQDERARERERNWKERKELERELERLKRVESSSPSQRWQRMNDPERIEEALRRQPSEPGEERP